MTISLLAHKHGLSRSTLLYYDRIGLLRPAGRMTGGYRRYTARDDERLRTICLYRRTGLPLAEIARILDRPRKDLAAVLERQLYEVVAQMEGLRERQRLIVQLLRNKRLLDRMSITDKDSWVRLLQACGFGDADLVRWHREFERTDPQHHQRFLEYIKIPPDEIRRIREWSLSAEAAQASGEMRPGQDGPEARPARALSLTK
jgi:MerR family transcriptional regulator, thiopeptide resistance regulator